MPRWTSACHCGSSADVKPHHTLHGEMRRDNDWSVYSVPTSYDRCSARLCINLWMTRRFLNPLARAKPVAWTLYLTQLLDWSFSNHMNVNVKKTKEMIISSSNSSVFSPLNVADCTCWCLLGVYINQSLKWDDHVRTTCNKAASRIYFLKQLKRSSVEPEELIPFLFYCDQTSPRICMSSLA